MSTKNENEKKKKSEKGIQLNHKICDIHNCGTNGTHVRRIEDVIIAEQIIAYHSGNITLIFFNWYSGGWSQLSPVGTAATNRPSAPAPSNYDDGEFGGIIGREHRSTLKKPAPVPLCPPQTPHAVWTRTRAASVGSQRLTA
jgi:hypothetical protein